MSEFPQNVWIWRDQYHYLQVANGPMSNRVNQQYTSVAAALEGQPCPKCAELEAQLGDAINAPTDYDSGFDQGWCGAWDFQEKELAELRAENERLRIHFRRLYKATCDVIDGIGIYNERNHRGPIAGPIIDAIRQAAYESKVALAALSPTEQETQETQENEPK